MRLIPYTPDTSDKSLKPHNAEMSEVDHNFLIYLLDKFRPKKILEVGVAAGGTSCVLLRHTGPGQHVYGVDLMTNYYRIPSQPVGFEIRKNCTAEEQARHTLITGRDVIDCIDEIGDGIDFCLLDTNHVLPGELLQFFVVYPCLKDGACLALHDISLNFHPDMQDEISIYSYFTYSTKLLFCTVGSKCKMIPDQDWPNIGAVVIDSETRRCIDTTFFALGISWFYTPGVIIEKYRNFIQNHYDDFCKMIFDQCIQKQRKLVGVLPK